MFMLDLFPKEIVLNILRSLEIITDVISLLRAISKTNNFKEFIHVCNLRCLDQCQDNPLTHGTPLRVINVSEFHIGGFNSLSPLINRIKPLNCDFILFKCNTDPFKIIPSLFKKISGTKTKILIQNKKNSVFVSDIHLENTSSLQLEDCHSLNITDCTVGKSNQKFYFKGLQELKVFSLTKSLYDLLDLNEYPSDVLLLSTTSVTYKLLGLPTPIDMTNWNNQTLRDVRITGLASLQNINLPKVEILHLTFEYCCDQEQTDSTEATLINNLNAPKLKEFKVEAEIGCPPLISNICLGTTLKEFSLVYLTDHAEFREYISSKNTAEDRIPVDTNLYKLNINLPNFIELESGTLKSKIYNYTLLEGGRSIDIMYSSHEILYKLEELKASGINQFAFTTQSVGFRTYLKVHSSIDMEKGYIYLICFEHLENLSFGCRP